MKHRSLKLAIPAPDALAWAFTEALSLKRAPLSTLKPVSLSCAKEKLRLVEIYNIRLTERERRRHFILDRGLLNIKRQQVSARRPVPIPVRTCLAIPCPATPCPPCWTAACLTASKRQQVSVRRPVPLLSIPARYTLPRYTPSFMLDRGHSDGKRASAGDRPTGRWRT